MILSDGSIRRALAEGRLIIDPIEEAQIQPASVDVRLGPEFLVFRNHTTEVIDPYDKPADLNERVRVEQGTAFVLHPLVRALPAELRCVALQLPERTEAGEPLPTIEAMGEHCLRELRRRA